MFIQRTDAEIHALSFGQGPLTLLAIGGFTASSEIWLDLFGHLPNWRCVAFDHRGTGATAHSGAITVQAMAEDVLAVADALGLENCILAAESAGAAVALRAVQLAPKRFLGQVLVGAAWQRVKRGAQDGFIAALQTDYAAALRSFIDTCMPETPSTGLRRWGLQMLLRANVADAVALLRCRADLPPDDALPRLTLATLLLHGTQDRIVPLAASRELATRLANCELHELPGLGHVPIVTAPADMAQRIDRFGQRVAQHRPHPGAVTAGPN